jgi:hypothetical protein
MESGCRDAARAGVPLDQKLHPKCANPSCATTFDWRGGGRFFRFRNVSAANCHGVQHYWLCEDCSNVLTLANEGQDVLVRPRAKASGA